MKISQIHISIYGLVIWLLSFSCAFAQIPYVPETSVEIKTESLADEIPGRQNKISKITIQSMDKSGNARQVGFFVPGTGELVGVLRLMISGAVFWKGAGETVSQFHADNLLIITGVSVPFDVLPIRKIINAEEPVDYDFFREAGGRLFTERIRITLCMVSKESAYSAGWIQMGGGVSDDALRMIEVTDPRTSELILKQLWTPEGFWWLYEETPFRRSWRIQ